VPPPAVLIRGADSPVVTAARAAEAAEANPAARIVTVPGAGHMVFWDERPAALATVRTELVRLLS
jgi:N-formylmaleamate deformylase